MPDRLAEFYYDPQQVRTLLGITKDRMAYWVRIGILKPKEPIKGLKKSYFLKEDIEALLEEIDQAVLTAQKANVTFRRATLEDLDAEDHLAWINFGSVANREANNRARRDFFAKNPESFLHLYNGRRLVACMNVVPLTERAIPEFVAGKRGWLFNPADIEQFEEGRDHPLHLIIINLMTILSVPPEKRRQYAADLLVGLSNQLAQWGREGIAIATVHASGGTPEGRHLLEKAGFTLINQVSDTRMIYFLDVAKSDLGMLRKYKRALEEYKASHT